MPQTAVEQAQLIAEVSDAYATATIATGFTETEVEAQQAQEQIIALTADLQASGFLPETYSGASVPVGAAETGAAVAKGFQALQKAGKWLAARGSSVAQNIKKHGVIYALGGTAVFAAHNYLTKDQQLALIKNREVTNRFKATMKLLCEVDPVRCKEELGKALQNLSKPPMAPKSGVPILLVVGAGALIAFAIWRGSR